MSSPDITIPVDASKLMSRKLGNLDSDITLYYSEKDDGFMQLKRELGERCSADCQVQLEQAKTQSPLAGWTPNPPCRANVFYCNGRRDIGVTLRGHKYSPNRELFPDATACDLAIKLVLDEIRDQKRKGLVIIAGETGSGKSFLAEKILKRHLNESASEHPHLICLGSPIEYRPEELQDAELRDAYEMSCMHYSPRRTGVDTCLDEALMDALRQKPCAVFVEETRLDTDWEPMLHFASTGHFAITTAHGGQIRDVIAWISSARNIRLRSELPGVFKNVIAILHVEKVVTGADPGKQLPEVWIGERGRPYLAAYGLAALVPQNDESAAYIAREYFASRPV